MRLINLIGIHSLMAVGLNLLIAFTGQISIAQAAFFGIGGYTSALLALRLGLPVWLCLLGAVIVTLLLSLAVAPITRLRGIFLAISTLVFAEIVREIIINWVSFTNGPNGLPQIPPPSIGSFSLSTDHRYYYLILFSLLIQLVLTQRLIDSRVGRAMRAIRDSEEAAAASGIPVNRYKIVAFVYASTFAGLAGALYAHLISYISPESLIFLKSVEIILMVVLGGMGSLGGSILGAAVVVVFPEVFRLFSEYRTIVTSFAILIILLFAPRGLAGAAESLLKALRIINPLSIPRQS